MLKDFTINRQNHPLGTDQSPRFSWKLVSDKQDVVQKKYHLQVITSGKLVWDSGEVESDCSHLIPYDGDALLPMTKYQAKICAWDNQGEVHQATSCFETGVLTEENWDARWITHTLDENETACPVFCRDIDLGQLGMKPEEIAAARLYITACGVYEAAINGCKVGDVFMAPGWTSYHNRILYQTYDVTELLAEGAKSSVEVTVGNGWYKGYLGFDERPNIYGDKAAVLAMVRIVKKDGSAVTVGTDTDWTVKTGCIRSSEIYNGEVCDLTFDEVAISNAVPVEDTSGIGKVEAQESEPVRITKRFSAIEKIVTPRGEIVLDFGQNLAGIVEVTLPPLKGDKLVIRHAETLDRDGNFYTENLRTAKSEDTYIYGKDDVGKTVMPHFTFHGFRYIALEGVGEDVDESLFVACAIHSDMEKTGEFCSDNKLVNKLVENIEWGQRGNFIDIPTDCPQRNERLGWTGDAQVFCSTASLNFNTEAFFEKWLEDMAYETTPELGVPHVVPNILANQEGAAAWSDAATIIPWNTYIAYGDKELLKKRFPMMKMWVDYITSKTSENGLWQTGFQYGDWLALDIESGSTDRCGGTDKYLVANAYYAYSTGIVRDAAKVLGMEDDYRKYDDLYQKIIDAINFEYVTGSGRLVSETQTACVLMLHFHLIKPEFRQKTLHTLERNLGAHRNHLTTGFVGTPYLCHCLSENGCHDLADEIFLKEDFPGWFYAVKKGATTIWERWNSVLEDGSFDESGMNSLNHYAYGSIGSWLYQKVAGINMAEPGYKKIRIEPLLTKGMTEINASYESIYGTIKSAWTCKDGKITVDIEIPANTTAEIKLPEKDEVISVGSGRHHYEYDTDTCLEVAKYSFDSTLGEVLKEELAVQMFEQFAPGMLDNPMIKFAYDMTLSELLIQAPEAKPMYQAVLDAINKI